MEDVHRTTIPVLLVCIETAMREFTGATWVHELRVEGRTVFQSADAHADAVLCDCDGESKSCNTCVEVRYAAKLANQWARLALASLDQRKPDLRSVLACVQEAAAQEMKSGEVVAWPHVVEMVESMIRDEVTFGSPPATGSHMARVSARYPDWDDRTCMYVANQYEATVASGRAAGAKESVALALAGISAQVQTVAYAGGWTILTMEDGRYYRARHAYAGTYPWVAGKMLAIGITWARETDAKRAYRLTPEEEASALRYMVHGDAR